MTVGKILQEANQRLGRTDKIVAQGVSPKEALELAETQLSDYFYALTQEFRRKEIDESTLALEIETAVAVCAVRLKIGS